MANWKVELNHGDIEDIEDSYSDMVLDEAKAIADRANNMRRENTAEYNYRLSPGRKGGRHYGIVIADAPSAVGDNSRNNTLLKALG